MNKYLSLFIAVFIAGCSTPYPDFDDCLRKFDQKFVEHFPKTQSNLVSYYCSYPSSKINLRMGVSLSATYSIKDVFALKESISSKSQKITFHTDTCNFILPVRHYSNHKIDMFTLNECSDTLKITPLPTFGLYLDELEMSDSKYLPDEYIIYIIESQKGIFLEAGNLIKGNNMPKDWQHGLSRGIAVNEKQNEAIYWVEIW